MAKMHPRKGKERKPWKEIFLLSGDEVRQHPPVAGPSCGAEGIIRHPN